MTILDRYILRAMAVNYAIALVVMISVYILMDMFVNMDEFTEKGYAFTTVVINIIDYYWPNIFVYFKELSAIITLFACAVSLVRMRRTNELTAMLASGVSLYRVAAPIVGFGVATTALLIVSTELIIPALAHKLARAHDDVDGQKTFEVYFLRDRDNALSSAGQFHPTRRDLRSLLVLSRDEQGGLARILEADRAQWIPPPAPGEPGKWMLERGRQHERLRVIRPPSPQEEPFLGRSPLYT